MHPPYIYLKIAEDSKSEIRFLIRLILSLTKTMLTFRPKKIQGRMNPPCTPMEKLKIFFQKNLNRSSPSEVTVKFSSKNLTESNYRRLRRLVSCFS